MVILKNLLGKQKSFSMGGIMEENKQGLSVVIPAYNEERLIIRCLDSILRELSWTNIPAEIIVVDNNSTDNTADIVGAKATQHRVIRLESEHNKGVVHARQHGFACSQYSIIANIDADSVLPTGWLSNALSAIADPEVVAASGPLVYYDMSRTVRVLAKFFYLLGWISHRCIGPMIQGGNYVVKRRALMQVDGYDTSIEFYGEDTATAMRLATVGKVKFLFSMWINSSGRRLIGEGLIKTTLRYSINYLWVTFRRKPFTKTYSDIRP
jgi:glycosyltransferase involved in cell wall biosynthesis